MLSCCWNNPAAYKEAAYTGTYRENAIEKLQEVVGHVKGDDDGQQYGTAGAGQAGGQPERDAAPITSSMIGAVQHQPPRRAGCMWMPSWPLRACVWLLNGW